MRCESGTAWATTRTTTPRSAAHGGWSCPATGSATPATNSGPYAPGWDGRCLPAWRGPTTTMTDEQTSALVRRTGDVRHRTRRAPIEVPSGNDHQRATEEKYYCPSCGQVRRKGSPFFRHQPIVGDV